MRRILILAAVSAAVLSAQSADCNRECLGGIVTQYLNALVAHDPSAAPLDSKVRFTEDAAEIKVGEGLWKTASGVTAYRQDMLDVRQGVAATHVVLEEAGKPVLFALRLKVAAKKITEIETLVTRGRADGALFSLDTLKETHPEMNIVPTAAQKASREEAIRMANFYPAGLKIGDFVKVDAPFAEDAYRIENGGRMAGPGCARAGCENIKTQKIIEHPALTSGVVAVDEDLGIVLLWMNFGDTGSYGAGNALIVYEAFKVWGGQIHAVEAFMKVLPAATKRGWE